MTEDQVLDRIDRTLNRIDARIEESERRWQEERQRSREDRQRWQEERTEHRRYNDALFERHARISADQIAAIESIRVQSAADSAALQAEIADQRSQIQAQTDALLKFLDRLPPERPQG